MSYRFIPPTFKKAWDRPLMTGVGPRISFDQGVSVVRISGTLQAVQAPSQDLLTAAGTQGVDWFLGGREYTVSDATAAELQAAGFTNLTLL